MISEPERPVYPSPGLYGTGGSARKGAQTDGHLGVRLGECPGQTDGDRRVSGC